MDPLTLAWKKKPDLTSKHQLPYFTLIISVTSNCPCLYLCTPPLFFFPVCQIMSKGVVAVLGPSASPASNSIISNICGEKEVSSNQLARGWWRAIQPHRKKGADLAAQILYLHRKFSFHEGKLLIVWWLIWNARRSLSLQTRIYNFLE